jgi:hypothetical protein
MSDHSGTCAIVIDSGCHDGGTISGPGHLARVRRVGDDTIVERRVLCPEGACIGLVGPDGVCRVCGRVTGPPPATDVTSVTDTVSEPGEATESSAARPTSSFDRPLQMMPPTSASRSDRRARWLLYGVVAFLCYEVYDLRQDVKAAHAYADDAHAKLGELEAKLDECADDSDLDDVKGTVEELDSKIEELDSRVSDLE